MTIEAIKLKPCPFCGSKATPPKIIFGDDKYTGCSNKECVCSYLIFRIEEWNTRFSESLRNEN